MTVEKRAYDIIANNRYLNLATYSNPLPWVAALAYSVTDDLDFIFYSAVESTHVRHLVACDAVAMSIYNSALSSDDVDGLQAEARCKMVEDSELDEIVPAYYQFSFPDTDVRSRWVRSPQDFAGDAKQKFFRLSVTNLYVIDLDNIEVDGRALVDIAGVRKKWR